MTPRAERRNLPLLLEGVSRKDLEARAGKISAAYRAGGTSAAASPTGMDALAYLVARFPATYAAAHAALRRVVEAMPQFRRQACWMWARGPARWLRARARVWPSLDAVTLLEPNAMFRDGGAGMYARCQDHGGWIWAGRYPAADLVTAGYVLAELAVTQVAAKIACELWRAADADAGAGRAGNARRLRPHPRRAAALIEEGAHVAAPCTHDSDCPMSESDWCHFSQRLARSRDHMIVKSASVPFEDERYAYLAASRAAGSRIRGHAS